VIITSFLFPSGKFSLERLQSVLAALGGDKSKLVLDLSCRRKDNTWFVAMDRWQTVTEMEITAGMTHECEDFELSVLMNGQNRSPSWSPTAPSF